MKVKKILWVTLCLVLAFTMCAFKVIPGIQLEGSVGKMDVLYMNASIKEDILTVDVNYETSDDFPYEIIKNISVKTDRNSDEMLQLVGGGFEENKYVYNFDLNGIDADKIYIEPPVLYTPVDIVPVKSDLELNSTIKDELGQNWFTISDTEIIKVEEGTAIVKVSILPEKDTMPRLPNIQIRDESYGGITAMFLDENDEFSRGEFFFYIPVDKLETEDDMLVIPDKSVKLEIKHSMERIDVKDVRLTSNVRELNVLQY